PIGSSAVGSDVAGGSADTGSSSVRRGVGWLASGLSELGQGVQVAGGFGGGGAGGEDQDSDDGQQGQLAARGRGEQGGDPPGHRAGPGQRDGSATGTGDSERRAQAGRAGGGGEQGDLADGAGHQAAVAGDGGGTLVGPALHGVVHRAGHREQERGGGGGGVRGGGEQVMPAGQVRVLMGEQSGPAAVVEHVEQAAGHHDPAGRAGQRVGLDGVAGHYDDAS